MWRHVASHSQSISSSLKPYLLSQGACTFKILETFTTETTTQAEPFITFVLGGPGSGKGTQCEKIAETFGFKHLSAGDLLRKDLASKSEHGSRVLNPIRKGKIVPAQVTVKLIKKEMESSDKKKFLIDGFPRSEENRLAFEKIIGVEPKLVLFFDCPKEEMVKRVLSRNQGRADDNIDILKKRFKVFEALTLPVISRYSEQGKLFKFFITNLRTNVPPIVTETLYMQISAVGTVDEIFERVRPIFASLEAIK